MNKEEQLWIRMCNLLFEMEQKWVTKSGDKATVRLYQRMMQTLDEAGYYVHNPLGEKYDETRTDVEASVCSEETGDADAEMCIRTVMKPVVYRKSDNDGPLLVQRGAVIVK
jgi:ribulose-5-phosphate 4-epimerase/fuculose-1-phosphate aldolase